jgi:hypothetical protein
VIEEGWGLACFMRGFLVRRRIDAEGTGSGRCVAVGVCR